MPVLKLLEQLEAALQRQEAAVDTLDIQQQQANSVFSQLKVCARDASRYGQVLFQQKTITLCLAYAQRSTEALKLLVNCIHQSDTCRRMLEQLPELGPRVLVRPLQSLLAAQYASRSDAARPDPTTSLSVFLYLRILFLMLAHRPSFCAPLVQLQAAEQQDPCTGNQNQDILVICLLKQILEIWIPVFQQQLAEAVAKQRSVWVSGMGEEPADVVQEAYKVAFTLYIQDGTSNMSAESAQPGSTASTSDSDLQRWIPPVRSDLCLHSLFQPTRQLFQPILDTLQNSKTLSNVPLPSYAQALIQPWTAAISFLSHCDVSPEYAHVFFPTASASTNPNSVSDSDSLDFSFVNGLETLLVQMLRTLDQNTHADGSGGQEGDDVLAEAVVQLLSLFLRMFQGSLPVRKHVKRRLLPDSMDRSRPLNQGSAPYNVLIRQLTAAISLSLKDCLGEFLWQLCDADANRFVHYVGYGPAAGVLLKKKHLRLPPLSERSVDDEGNPLGQPSTSNAVDPVTGALFGSLEHGPKAGEDMTQEEKEKENARLLDLFERLNRTGIIRMEIPEELKTANKK